ncbi:MAG: hypothetical protein H0T62_02950 [Parachlamydiaceae bacterium]|nr:hypothetical protein [Parachlamydiaceae bacterium]
MEMDINELQSKIELLTKKNTELLAFKQDHSSAKQSLVRMSTRLKKLCKRLEPTNEIVQEMKGIAEEIQKFAREVTS